MKKHVYVIALSLSTMVALCQRNPAANFKYEYKRLADSVIRHTPASSNRLALMNAREVRKNLFYNDNKTEYGNVNTAGNGLMQELYNMESHTYYKDHISDSTRRLITHVKEPYALVLLERAIKEDRSNTNENDTLSTNYAFKDKILKEVSKQMNLNMAANYPYYTYPTKSKKIIKFISIRTGNDLFTPTGLVSEAYPKGYYVPDNSLFQRNDDRDYTGSLLVEVGTDYLNVLRKRPVKSYQTLLYGFDVYTPYFRDTAIFKNDTSNNKRDRPHASFQYFGWSKKSLSKYNKLRWSTTLKFGKIGGSAGKDFQNALHQDVSYSPRPKGWGAQISNGGRLGISAEFKQEYQFYLYEKSGNPNSIFNINLSPFLEEKLGTYMTNASLGLQLSNKTFVQNNANFITQRQTQSVKSVWDPLMWSVGFNATYVAHNTMLERYGLFSTSEGKNDQYTPRSLYYLNYGQVRRMTYKLNVCLSYTARFATVFYNWSSFSPETTLGKIGINSPSGHEMDISKRWQHFAEVGLIFNLH